MKFSRHHDFKARKHVFSNTNLPGYRNYLLGVIIVAPVLESTGGFVVVQPEAKTSNKPDTKSKIRLLILVAIKELCLF